MQGVIGSSPLVSTTSEQAPLTIPHLKDGVFVCFRCSSFSAKSHARLTCSVVNALATVRCCYQLFAGLLLKQIFILSKVSTSRWISRFITRLVFRAGFQIASSPLLISRKSPATLRLFAAYHFFAIARLWRA